MGGFQGSAQRRRLGQIAGIARRSPARPKASSTRPIVSRPIRSRRAILRPLSPIRCSRTTSCNRCTSVLLAAIKRLLGRG